jgi:hypothetical protein
MPANPTAAPFEVVPMITYRKKKVATTLSIRRAGISFRFDSSRPLPKYAACCVLPPS